jgi:hypothetical protein
MAGASSHVSFFLSQVVYPRVNNFSILILFVSYLFFILSIISEFGGGTGMSVNAGWIEEAGICLHLTVRKSCAWLLHPKSRNQ